MPAGLGSAYVATKMDARTCELRTGSRTKIATCKHWTATQAGVPLEASEVRNYRLVGTLGGTTRRFMYSVLPIHTSYDATAQPVQIQPEP